MRAGACLILIFTGCSTYEVIPDHLEGQVREDIQLEQVETAPDSYKGETVVWGGAIQGVSVQGDQIKIEVLQLPLDRTLRPLDSKAASRGRFLAIDSRRDIKDPALLNKGALVTVIGAVQGLVTSPLDLGSYDAPALRIRDMTVWERQLGLTQFPPGTPFVGYRPFVFWEGHRVADR
jgi:outer membrane lipoprotein